MKLIGPNCPLLFDKWQPIEFNDFNLDEFGRKYPEVGKNSINQTYVFPFANLDINFDSLNTCVV